MMHAHGWHGHSWGTGFVLVNEVEADPTSPGAASFAGAGGGFGAIVEYLVDAGAAAPAVEVAITSGGSTDDWKDSAIAPGFHIHHLGHLPPGAKITLTATEAMARVRWCETICC